MLAILVIREYWALWAQVLPEFLVTVLLDASWLLAIKQWLDDRLVVLWIKD